MKLICNNCANEFEYSRVDRERGCPSCGNLHFKDKVGMGHSWARQEYVRAERIVDTHFRIPKPRTIKKYALNGISNLLHFVANKIEKL